MSDDADDFDDDFDDPFEEDEAWFINHYCCPRCDHEWSDEWDAMSDDDCPNCGCRHITPYHSDEGDEDDEMRKRKLDKLRAVRAAQGTGT